jgi:hypothetical protein
LVEVVPREGVFCGKFACAKKTDFVSPLNQFAGFKVQR